MHFRDCFGRTLGPRHRILRMPESYDEVSIGAHPDDLDAATDGIAAGRYIVGMGEVAI